MIPMTYPKPDGGGTVSKTLAVRFYSANDLQRLHNTQIGKQDYLAQELEGLKSFASSFATSIVFFECSPSEDQTVATLDSPDSFPRQAMHQLTTKLHPGGKMNCITNIVKSSKAALDIIFTFANFMEPGKIQSREAFFRKQEMLHGVPASSQRNSQDEPSETPQQQQRRRQAQSYRVCEALRALARDLDFPVGEEDVLMQMSQNLQSIATPGNLEHIPLDESTRFKLQNFFCTGEADPNDSRFVDQRPAPSSMDSRPSLFDTVASGGGILGGGFGGEETAGVPMFGDRGQPSFARNVPMDLDPADTGPEIMFDDSFESMDDVDQHQHDSAFHDGMMGNNKNNNHHHFEHDQAQHPFMRQSSRQQSIAPPRGQSYPPLRRGMQYQSEQGVFQPQQAPPPHQPAHGRRLTVSQRYGAPGRSSNTTTGMSQSRMGGRLHANQSFQMGQNHPYRGQQATPFGRPTPPNFQNHRYNPPDAFMTRQPNDRQQEQIYRAGPPAPMREPPQPWPQQTPSSYTNSRMNMPRSTVARPGHPIRQSQFGSHNQFRQWM